TYNMPIPYIDFLPKNPPKHSQKFANQYSKNQLNPNPQLYTSPPHKDNFPYPYSYPDFTYPQKLKQKKHYILIPPKPPTQFTFQQTNNSLHHLFTKSPLYQQQPKNSS
ncbi:lysozyme family protein, partial [Bacillus altitudinis]|uniref:lysozyme family protein n=1 Tax=Bacillus altitudinis TaxID=293387 RepID=UPI001643CA39